MLTLIKGADAYSPARVGVKDVLLASNRIAAVQDSIELAGNLEIEVIDARGKTLTPGVIDGHVHLIGGGGEGQTIFNFFVVLGSGQAALKMPLMAPVAEIVGVSRQVVVLAFQLGDGLPNLIVPTSGALIGTLGVARLDWLTWARFQFKYQLGLFAVISLAVFLAVWLGYR